MTIHTFEASTMLTNDNFYSIQDKLKSKDKSKWKGTKNGMAYWGLSENGILIHMYQIKKKDFYSYSITYRISARRVMENDNFVGLFNTKNYPKLENKVNELLKDKCFHLPKLNKCTLRRIDFCINAKLDNQDQVKAYIKIAKRANIPSKLELYNDYDKISKRTKPTKDDYTVYSSEYIAVSIYNKYAEMKKRKEKTCSDKEFKKAKNIVRIEIRCMEGKVQALKKKFNIDSIKELMINADIIGNDLYNYYLTKMFGSGIICTLNQAVKRIDMSGYKKENIEILTEFIKDSNMSRSSAETIREYKNIYGKSEVKRILYMLDNIDTNYVTVTNSDVKLFKDRYIPTPIEVYNDFKN